LPIAPLRRRAVVVASIVGAATAALAHAPLEAWGAPRVVCDLLALLAGLAASGATYFLLGRQARLQEEFATLKQHASELESALADALHLGAQAEQRSQAIRQTDGATGLATRAAFCEALERQLTEAKSRDGDAVLVLVVQLELSHAVATAYGGGTLDIVIGKAATRLGRLRHWGGGPIGRIGELEIAACTVAASAELNIAERAQELATALSRTYTCKGGLVRAHFGIGFSRNRQGNADAEELLTQASAAAREALRGGGVWREYEPLVRERAVTRLQFADDLRYGLKDNSLRLHYQPFIAAHSHQPAGFEVLLRWQHPQEGLLHPHRFLPAAQDAGLLLELDRWVMRHAVLQLRQWNAEYPERFFVSLNISPQHFTHRDLAVELRALIEQHGISPEQIHLEILERTLNDDTEAATRVATELRDLGVRLWLDGFGTVNSSLSCLRALPVHALKVDRSFVSRITQDSKDFGLVRTIVDLAHYLELKCVVTGVETSEQHELLELIAADYCQGDFYSPPVPIEKLSRFLTDAAALRRTA
jgi:EAL domain-containing protein (putative c-di-GMP-specific phosphodiesterase class I)/GGDEF domain-containing protein